MSPLLDVVARRGTARETGRAVARRPAGALAATAAGALGVYLACGAVAPVAALAAARVGILATGPAAWAGVLVAVAAGWWLSSRARPAPLWLLSVLILPWLPAPAAPALLLWHGPIAWLVIGTTAILVAWPVLARAGRAVTARRAREQAALALLVAAAVYALAAWRMQPQLPGGDEPHYLVITQSLLADRDLRIENNHRQGDYRAYTGQELKPDFLRRGADGQIYSIHAPGISAFVLPAFAVAGYPGAVAWLVLVSALGAMLAWLAAHRLTGDATAAWVGWAAVALSAPFFFQAFTVFPDATGAVLTMACVSALVAPERLRSSLICGGCGAVAAALPWLHTRYAIVAAVAGVLLALRVVETPGRRAERLAALAIVPVVSAVAWFGFFHSIYGTFSPAAPYGGYTQSSILNAPRGLTGLLIDQQFGLLPNAPVYAVAFAGVWSLWHLCRRLAAELLAIAVPYAVAVGCYHMWWGGRSAPARFLVPVLLPLALPVAAWWRRGGHVARAFAAAALGGSVALAAALAWVDRGALVYNVRDGYALWLDALAPLVRLPLALPSLFRGGLAAAWAIAAAWAAVIALAGIVAHSIVRAAEARGTPGTAPDGPVIRVAVAGALLAAAALASVAGWRIAGAAGADPGAGLLRVLRAAEAGEGRGWRSERPLATVRPGDLASSIVLPPEVRRVPDAASPAWMGRDLPPGRYAIESTSGLRVDGRVAVLFGRDGVTLADAALRDAAPGGLPVHVDLPGGAALLRVAVDGQAKRTAGAMALRLVAPLAAAGRAPGAYARSVVRAGGATAWLLDGNAFVEPAGFWVRGGSEAVLVVDGGGRSPEVVLRAGPVSTTVTVTVGRGDPAAVTLAPGAFEVLWLPAATPAAVRIASSSGFRPRDRDPASADGRWLGVRVELGQNLTTPPK